jgi:hypothetical protein
MVAWNDHGRRHVQRQPEIETRFSMHRIGGLTSLKLNQALLGVTAKLSRPAIGRQTKGRIGGQLIWGNQVQLAHKMTLGTQYFPDDLLSMMVGTSRFTIRAIIESSVWPKHKAAIKH